MEKACLEKACVTACKENWEEKSGRCFLWGGNKKRSWDEAEEFCQKEGGHLASVTSEAIHEYIIKEKNRKGVGYLWLGGSDKEEEGVWKWSDGSPWEFAKLNKGEPRNGSEEHCLIVAGHNVEKWNDYDCKAESNFVCSQTLCSGRDGISVRVDHSFTPFRFRTTTMQQ